MSETTPTIELPRSDDPSELCLGEAVTACCGATVTIAVDDGALCCRACYGEIF